MFYNAKNGTVVLPDSALPYLCFGRGRKTLVMLPGVGDGLKTVEGMAAPFALFNKKLARDFTVYVFSRRTPLPAPFTTREMATDVCRAMDGVGA